MSTPAPRPALKKAADAHIHPAAPGHSLHSLRRASDDIPAPAPPRDDAVPTTPGHEPEPAGTSGASGADAPHRLSGPLRGTTSDSLRAAAKKARKPPTGKAAEKPVDLGVKVPKSLRKDFRAAVKSDGKDPDAVVTALLKAWLGT
ncbi:MAG: hypothetical protein MUF09_06715 [Candidatus Nanopelagicales bacterium]|jgi:hypothetical protein|nr:hypothetical protein [Candidatus Nanopelagicales bacterium]